MKSNNIENITKTIDRLSLFLETQGLSFNKLSIMIGVSNSYFSKMAKNHASVGSDILEKIVRIFPDLNSEWLLSGKGTMIKDDESDMTSDAFDRYEDEAKVYKEKLNVLKSSLETLEENPNKNYEKDIEEVLLKMERILSVNRKLHETVYRLSKSNEKLATTVEKMSTFIGNNRKI